MIRRIFLDLDDVCNTMTMHLLRYVGCQVDPRDHAQYPSHIGYDISEAANFLLGRRRFAAPGDFWQAITRPVWAECPTSEIFPWVLHRAARLVSRENVCIATCPIKCPECLAGKLDWIHRYMPPWMHRQYAITPRKHFLARPDTLLIDDNADNINRFQAEGGHGVLVPAPWNKLWGTDPFEALESQMERLF